jgi:hypothetical protein
MKLPQHIVDNALNYLVLGAIAFFGLAGLAFFDARQDARHITRSNWIQSEIRASKREVEKLTMYNQFGTAGNKPARDQIILQTKHHIESLERDLEELNE